MSDKKMKIFVSHSSKDIAYVSQIVNLLEGMGLDQTQIFCSSLPGYGIPIDKNIFDYLREQFMEYNLHVIFIHSDNYYMSTVSLNEMGAAWVLKSTVTSILLPGFEFEKMTGVVNNQSIAIKLDGQLFELQDKLNQLHDKIVSEFDLIKRADIIWQQRRDSFIEDVLQIRNGEVNVSVISDEADTLLRAAAIDPNGQILKIFDYSKGVLVQGGLTVMNEEDGRRESAKWIAVLDELIKNSFVEQTDLLGEKFQITDAGYKFIEG